MRSYAYLYMHIAILLNFSNSLPKIFAVKNILPVERRIPLQSYGVMIFLIRAAELLNLPICPRF